MTVLGYIALACFAVGVAAVCVFLDFPVSILGDWFPSVRVVAAFAALGAFGLAAILALIVGS